MRRRRMGRPGLVGTMARTAVVAGTATAVVGGVQGKQQAKQQAAANQQATEQSAAQSEQQIAELQAQVDAMQAQQQPAAAPAAPAGSDLTDQLKQLADMKASGILSDAEFADAKAKLLAG